MAKVQSRFKLFFNALGAVITAVALLIIIVTKFMEGAWIILVIAPLLAWLLTTIKQHYLKMATEIAAPTEWHITKSKPTVVIIPINDLNRASEKAIRFGLTISDNIIAVHISAGNEEEKHRFKALWAEKITHPMRSSHLTPPCLKIIHSPYRRIYKPILNAIKKTQKKYPNRFIAVIIPELIEPHWYEHLLHNVRAIGLRTLIFLNRDPHTVIITTPWYLR